VNPRSLIGAIQILTFSDDRYFSLIPSWCDPRNNHNLLNHAFAMQSNNDYIGEKKRKDTSSFYTNFIPFIFAHLGLGPIWFGSCKPYQIFCSTLE
jgi:hypothetical protein